MVRRFVRLGAGQFWLRLFNSVLKSIVFAVLVGLVSGIGLVLVGASQATQELVMVGTGVLVGLQAIYSQLMVAAERCRAVGRSGWWCLLLIVPFVGPLWLLADLTFRPAGQQGSPT